MLVVRVKSEAGLRSGECPRARVALHSVVIFCHRRGQDEVKMKCVNKRLSYTGGRHSSVVLSAPTILWPRVRIPSTPSTLFTICFVEIETVIDE